MVAWLGLVTVFLLGAPGPLRDRRGCLLLRSGRRRSRRSSSVSMRWERGRGGGLAGLGGGRGGGGVRGGGSGDGEWGWRVCGGGGGAGTCGGWCPAAVPYGSGDRGVASGGGFSWPAAWAVGQDRCCR